LEGREHDQLCALDRLEHARGRSRARHALEAHREDRIGRTAPDEPLLKVQLAVLGGDARAPGGRRSRAASRAARPVALREVGP